MHFLGETQDYAMFPVWLLSTKWNNANFLFAINGQTGKMTGNLPIDKKKQWLRILMIAIPLLLLGCLLGRFKTGGIIIGVIFGLIGGLITNSINVSSMKPVSQKTAAIDYVGTESDGSRKTVKLSVKEDRYVNTTTKREKINQN